MEDDHAIVYTTIKLKGTKTICAVNMVYVCVGNMCPCLSTVCMKDSTDCKNTLSYQGPLKNLALKRKAYQSTKGGWDPNLAVDGSTYYQPWGKAGSCTHTGTEPHPWWYVDLGHVYHIQSIKVQTRVECCGIFSLQNKYVLK